MSDSYVVGGNVGPIIYHNGKRDVSLCISCLLEQRNDKQNT